MNGIRVAWLGLIRWPVANSDQAMQGGEPVLEHARAYIFSRDMMDPVFNPELAAAVKPAPVLLSRPLPWRTDSRGWRGIGCVNLSQGAGGVEWMWRGSSDSRSGAT